MKVTVEVEDYSNPRMPNIKVHNSWNCGDAVEIEVEGKRYTVIADEMIEAIEKAMVKTR